MTDDPLGPTKAERAKNYVRPLRMVYRHIPCGTITTLSFGVAEVWARWPEVDAQAYCASCQRMGPVGSEGEFAWDDGEMMGT